MASKLRVQVEDPLFNAAPTLVPRARAVDPFVNPSSAAPVRDTRLNDLGDALAGLAGSLTKAGVASGRLMDDADFERARSDTRAAGGALSDAVRAGRLQVGESPAYLRGLASAKLSALGTLFDSEFKESFSRSTARGSDDPNAVQEFAGEFQKSFAENHLGEFDPEDVALFFEPKEIGAIKQVMANHREIRLARKEAEGFEAIGIQASQMFSAYDAIPKEMQNVQVLTENLRALGDPKREGSLPNLGLSLKKSNDAIVKAGVEAAVANRDVSILDAVRNIPTHSGGRFGSIAEYKKLLRTAEEHISKESMRDFRDAEYLRGVRQANEGEKVVSKMNKAIESGNFAGARGFLEELNEKFPKLVAGMRGAIVSALNESFVRRITSEQAFDMETALQTPGATVDNAIAPFAQFLDAKRMGLAFMTLRINREYRGFLSSNDYKDALKGLITKLTAQDEDNTTSKLVSTLDAPDVKAAFRRRVVEALSGKKNGQVLTLEELSAISKVVADNPAFGIGIAKEANQLFMKEAIDEAVANVDAYPDALEEGRQVAQQLKRVQKLFKQSARVGFKTRFDAATRLKEFQVIAEQAQDAVERAEQKALDNEPPFTKSVRLAKEKAKEDAERDAALDAQFLPLPGSINIGQ